ncbi:D-alanyl-D-alanine carboxypeptidase family protein [Hyphomicrobium sp.]|uniref:D-alanyl-D-alanine carboxypeptidase family protein n=1 Tax=Hyphomicrobium sp. TaxID=82 RepID=UPI002D771ECC|nr:D-alanyl-D-alanine carboxypeptidase family protein [Hyphomicrobium sp.]HET6388311.1 D-alanyl-D-alanine carboxypeptidase family protein [Hyphomicrobium sp.]
MRSRATCIVGAVSIWLTAVLPASASPTLLFEPSTGKVLYSEDADDIWHPASLTKLMTAYVAFEAIKEGKIRLEDKIPCSLVATLQPPSKVGLNVGATLSVEQALKAVIIKSANDVTVMLAEAISGSESAFIDKMNATARRLGMTHTNFVNTNGLPDPGQLTSARDIAKISRAVVSEYPQYASYWAMPDMRIGKKRLGSHNALLRTFPGADGLKTGFTCDSGYNVVASATRDGRQLMAVVLGESSGNERAIRAASLLEYGFQTYDWKQVFNTTTIDNMPMDPNPKGVMSVRHTVAAWGCNPQKRQAVAGKSKTKHKVAASKKNSESADDARSALKGPDSEGLSATSSASTAHPEAAQSTSE